MTDLEPLVNILAIDPGLEKSAWVMWNVNGGGILDSSLAYNDEVRAEIDYMKHEVEAVVIEEICCYGMPVGQDVLKTCEWVGRFKDALLIEGEVDVYDLPRQHVKLELCGSARAKDSNIRQALIDRIGPPGTKKSPGPTYGMKKDLWSALAVAVAFCSLYERDKSSLRLCS